MATREEAQLGPNLTRRTLIAQGDFQARAYIFLRRWGGNGFGHVGWGFRVDDDGCDCGSLENSGGGANVGYNQLNNAWFKSNVGTQEMLAMMRGGFGERDNQPQSYGGDPVLAKGKYLPRPEPYSTNKVSAVRRLPNGDSTTNSFDVWRYTEYAWFNVNRSNISKAHAMAVESPNIGYNALGNNCLDLTYRIVEAYGVPADKLPYTQDNAYPSTWFDACVRYNRWHRERWPDRPA